jgi:hypothetical protein
MPTDDAGDDEAYGGVLGAFPYAFRATDSGLCKSYVVLGTLVAAGVTALFGLALVVLVANTLGSPGGTFTFSRAFFILVGLLVVAPIIAPSLLVARRHRRSGSDTRYDATIAACGYLFFVALYVGLVVSTPESQQSAVSGPLGGVVAALYSLPRWAGVVPPLIVVGLMALAHRVFG